METERQIIEIEIGNFDMSYQISDSTNQSIDEIFEIYKKENQSIEKLNKIINLEIENCINLLSEKEIESSILRSMSEMKFQVLIQKIVYKLKEKNIWKIKKRILNGKTLYSLIPN